MNARGYRTDDIVVDIETIGAALAKIEAYAKANKMTGAQVFGQFCDGGAHKYCGPCRFEYSNDDDAVEFDLMKEHQTSPLPALEFIAKDPE